MQNLISQTFSISAQRETVSVDHTDNYYLIEATGNTPTADDSRWQYVAVGGTAPIPTPALPYLWHKSITYLTDGTYLNPVIEFGGSLGQNGIDYDLVPSSSSILKAEDGTLTPTSVSCSLIKRNADGSATNQTTIPAGYSINVIKDTTSSSYALGFTISTDNCSVITFVLLYGTVEIERHDVRVIVEGTEGIAGRGIQSQDYRFKANSDGIAPSAPSGSNADTQWNTWCALSAAGYSSENKYLWRCLRTVYVDGNGNTETTYIVDGPTAWGTDGKDVIFLNLDNEMDAIPADSEGKVLEQVELTAHARLYKASSVLTSGLTAPTPANIKLGTITPSVSLASGIITVKWTIPDGTELSSSHYAVSIPVTYNDGTDSKTYSATFIANVVRSGEPGVSPAIYQLLLSDTEVSFARDSSNSLTPAQYPINCGYTKNYKGSITSYPGTSSSEVANIDSKYYIFYRPVNADGSYGSWSRLSALASSNFTLTIPSDTTYTAYDFVLSSSSSSPSSSTIIDRETLPINKDGLNGLSGESAFIIDLDNEMDSFGTDNEGKISASVSRETKVSMYYGLSPLALTKLEVAKSYEDGTACGSEVAVSTSTATGKVTVTLANSSYAYTKTIFLDITATCSRGSKTTRFTLQPQAAGAPGENPIIYQLHPVPSALSFARNDDNSLNPVNNILYCNVKVIEGEETTIHSAALAGYRIFWAYGHPTTPAYGIQNVGGTITVPATGSFSAANYSEITLELWRMDGNAKGQRLDRETVPINKDGEKGEQGNPGKNGDTPFLIDIDNEMTSVPISQEGYVESKQDLFLNLAAYYGSKNIINDTDDNGNRVCAVSCVDGSDSLVMVDVTTNPAYPHITIAQNFQPSKEILELRFRVTHATYGSRDAVFSIAFVKAGGQGLNAVLYELLPSLSQISVGRNDDGSYNPSTIALTCGYKKTDGPTTTTVEDSTASFDGYDIYFRRHLRSSSAWQTTYYRYRSYKSYLASLNVASYSKVQFIICKNTAGTISNSNLDDANVSGLIDRETVPVVADGLRGAAGTNAFVIDLDNEMDGIAVTTAGAAAAAQSWQITAKAFYGSTQLQASGGVTFYLQDIAGTGTSGTAITTKNSAGDTVEVGDALTNGILNIASSTGTWTKTGKQEITIRASHATYGSRDAIFTLRPIFPGENGKPVTVYNLYLSRAEASFKRDSSNALTPSSILINCGYSKNYNGIVTNFPGTDRDNLWTTGGAPYNIFCRPISVNSSGTVTYGSWVWMKDCASTNNYALSIPSSTAYTAYEFILSSASGTASIADTNIIDRETIPIMKDGAKGDTGTGIKAITYHRRFTQFLEEPSTSDSGWFLSTSDSYPTAEDLSETNRYLWQKKTTTYTNTDVATTYEISLLAQYDIGQQENLLEQTAFANIGQLDAWSIHDGTINEHTIGEHNSFGRTPDFEKELTHVLKQTVYKQGDVYKLKPNTWYTLSFYAAMFAQQTMFSGTDYNGNGTTNYVNPMNATAMVYLAAGQSMDLTVTARCYSTNVFFRFFAWAYQDNGSSWRDTQLLTFTSTSNTTQSVRVTNNDTVGRVFYLKGWVYLNGTYTVNGESITSSPSSSSPLPNNLTNNANAAATTYRCYVTSVIIDRGAKLSTYLYRSDNGQAIQHSSSAPWYVDGTKVTAAKYLSDADSSNDLHSGTYAGFSNDGYVLWQLTPDTARHSVTFKTPSSLAAGVTYSVIFRMNQYSHYGWICMPKLEENTMATAWIEHANDRLAEDFQHIFVGEWVASTSDTTSTYYLYASGIRHVVLAKESASSSAKVYFRMKQRTTSEGYCSTIQPYLDTTHWEKASHLKFTASDFLLAEEALIKLATMNRILVLKDDGTTVAAGMGGSNYPIWAGASEPENAPFRVSIDGIMRAVGAELLGKVIAGEETGQRLELDPDTKSLIIYDSSGEMVSVFEGNTYAAISNLFANESGTFVMNSNKSKFITQTNGTDLASVSSSNTYQISSYKYTSTPTEVTVSGSLQVKAFSKYKASSTNGNGTVNLKQESYANAYVYLRVVTYKESSLKTVVSTKNVLSLSASANASILVSSSGSDQYVPKFQTFSNVKVKVPAGYHVLEVYYSQSAAVEGSYAQCAWGTSCTLGTGVDPSGSYNSDFYVSRFFANGFVVGLSASNYVCAYNGTNDGMHLIAENNNYGINISSAGVKVKIGTSSWKTISLASDGTMKAT